MSPAFRLLVCVCVCVCVVTFHRHWLGTRKTFILELMAYDDDDDDAKFISNSQLIHDQGPSKHNNHDQGPSKLPIVVANSW